MKKSLLIILCLVLIISMTACGGAKEEAAAPADGAAAGPEYTIRFAHIENEFTACAQGVQVFKKYVEEGSDGRIAVEVLGSGSMGGEREILEGVTMGTIEGGMAMSSLFTTYLPDWNVFDLPFVFKDRADWAAKVDGEMGKLLADETASIHVKILSYFDGGFRVISNTKRPILGMADFKGMKNRVGESTLMIDTHKALGDNPIPMSFGEIYTALQQGTIDGVDTSVIYVQDGNFQEVTKYCTLTNHTALQMVTFINQDFFDSLPADLQQVVMDAAAKTTVDQRKIAVEVDGKAMQIMKDAGVTIETPSAEFTQQMIDATMPVVEGYKDQIDAKIFDLAY
ncbi:MAG TPA: TRAP transporter substrate-binding protein [Anaerovoracaceae bacterium]|nr:TRAP transporter substrate-binding protein [Anaerovoracaceae bacterium]